MAEHPEWNRSRLVKLMKSTYYWLLKNDRAWLEDHSQLMQPHGGPGGFRLPPEDWVQRDIQLASEIKTAAQRLRDLPTRPIRISRSTLSGDIHQRKLLYNQLAKLPLTARVLDEVVETHEEAGIRRLWWVAGNSLRNHFHVTRYELIIQAGVYHLRRQPVIQERIDCVLSTLHR